MKAIYNDGHVAELPQEEELHVIRHTAAHIMAQAIQRLHPQAKFAYGPATERGFYYPFREFAPGAICRTTAELGDALREALSKEGTPAEVQAFRERFMGACDGHATERILQAVEAL